MREKEGVKNLFLEILFFWLLGNMIVNTFLVLNSSIFIRAILGILFSDEKI